MIGFGSDRCNAMMGSVNSVASRLKNTIPGIFILQCVCIRCMYVQATSME